MLFDDEDVSPRAFGLDLTRCSLEMSTLRISFAAERLVGVALVANRRQRFESARIYIVEKKFNHVVFVFAE